MSAELPPDAYACALAAILPLGPRRLEAVVRKWPPEDAWDAVRTGEAADAWGCGETKAQRDKVQEAIDQAVKKIDPGRLWARCQATGVEVHVIGRPGYPELLAADISPPPVLFARGDLGVLDARRATIVGTRNATAAGREMAAELGRGLAEAGVVVVSGLARGIDGWAHRGALQVEDGAPPVGVVASGPDVVYPPEHQGLWHDVVTKGVLLSEVPPGMSPHAYRFPLRNRILAALGEVVVVVESRHTGGSMHTVNEAIHRGVTVMAVPGSPRNPAAEGTNHLLVDGATPVVAPIDVLLALGVDPPGRRRRAGRRSSAARAGADGWMLSLLGTDQRDIDALVRLSGRSVAEVVDAATRLEDSGLVRRRAGWYEQVQPSGSSRR